MVNDNEIFVISMVILIGMIGVGCGGGGGAQGESLFSESRLRKWLIVDLGQTQLSPAVLWLLCSGYFNHFSWIYEVLQLFGICRP